jgi:hypothetical protein
MKSTSFDIPDIKYDRNGAEVHIIGRPHSHEHTEVLITVDNWAGHPYRKQITFWPRHKGQEVCTVIDEQIAKLKELAGRA